MAKTLQNVLDDVEKILGDTSNTIWTEAELQSYIKEGYDELAIKTEILWKKDTPSGLDDVAGTATYSLPSDLYKIERMTWDNKRIFPLDPVQLERTDPQFRTTQGDVFGYIVSGDGLGTVRKVRVPSANATGKTGIEYVRRGAALSSGSVELEIPDRYVKYVRFFAVSRALERDGPGQKPEGATHFMGRFNAGVARIRRRKSEAQKARTGSFGRHGVGGILPSPRLPSNYGHVVRW